MLVLREDGTPELASEAIASRLFFRVRDQKHLGTFGFVIHETKTRIVAACYDLFSWEVRY